MKQHMKQHMKMLSLALALALVVAALAGCVPNPSQAQPGGKTADPTDTSHLTADGKVKLEFWYAASGTSGEMITALIDEFNASQDKIQVAASYSGNSFDSSTKVSAALLAGNQPDVALIYAGPLYTGERDSFEIAAELESRGFDLTDVFEGMWEYCKYGTDDRVCAVPFGISTQVMYYNKNILDAAGLDMEANPPKTWAEFAEVAKKAQQDGNANNSPDFYGFDVSDYAWLFKSMLMQNGCPVVEAEGSNVTPLLNTPEAVEVMTFWKENFVDTGIMVANQHGNAEKKFESGNLGFIAMSSNRISRWAGNLPFEFGAIEMPYFESPSVALGGMVLISLSTNENVKPSAYDLIAWLAAEEQQTRFALGSGYLPIHKSALETQAAQDAIASSKAYQVAFNQLSYTWSYIHFGPMGTMDISLEDGIAQVETGSKTPQEMLDYVNQEVLREIEEDQRNREGGA